MQSPDNTHIPVNNTKGNMAPTLYMMWRSQPVRAVLMTAKAIDLDLDLIDLKEQTIARGDHKTPEYLKLNPQHTVPTLVDRDGFILWDSHAIMPYLLSTYATRDDQERLYPSDPKKRALVNQRLHFECGVLFPRTMKVLRPLIYRGITTMNQEDIDAIYEAYDFLERFLEHGSTEWMAGEGPTIADYSLVASVTSSDILFKVDTDKYKRLGGWLRRCEDLPENAPNKKGLEVLRNIILSSLKR